MLCLILAGCTTTKDQTDNANDGLGVSDSQSQSDGDEEKSENTTVPDKGNTEDSDKDANENQPEAPSDIEQGDTENEDVKDPENGENKEPSTENNEEETPSPENPIPDNPTPDEPALPEYGTSAGYRFRDLTISTVDGGSVSTENYRGKIIILNLWATWCPPCKAELPDFSKIASEYKDSVVVIAAHVPYGRENAISYIETNLPESDIIFAYDTDHYDAFYAAGGIEAIPQTVIIDENGVILYSGAGMLSYEVLVEIIEYVL